MIIYFVNVVFPVVSSCVVAAVKSAQLTVNKCLLLNCLGTSICFYVCLVHTEMSSV